VSVYSGVVVPLVTPVGEDGEIDERGLAALIEYVRPDVAAIMPALSSGEGWKLDERRWHELARLSRLHSGDLPVLLGIQVPDTEEVIRRAKAAQALGVDAIVVTTPFDPDLGQQQILEHYQAIRAAVELPLFLYNEQALSGNRIELETLLRICALGNIAGIKESSGSAEFTRALLAADLGIPVFEGWENQLLQVPGVAGFIGPLANLEAGLCGRMLVDPTPALQDEINQTCERYGLFADEWYRGVKKELVARGVIGTDRVVAP
jgi:4-hydroxy-tetrahydrodipicolinate synthase